MPKILEMMVWMNERMKKMELSQTKIDQDERIYGAVDNEIFSLMLGAELAGKLHRDALDLPDLWSHQVPHSAMDHIDGFRPNQQKRVPQRAQQLPQPPATLPPF